MNTVYNQKRPVGNQKPPWTMNNGATVAPWSDKTPCTFEIIGLRTHDAHVKIKSMLCLILVSVYMYINNYFLNNLPKMT